MTVNSKKTKEMVLGPLSKESTTPLLMTGNLVQQVTQYKLLGVTINAVLNWDHHVNAITSRAAKRLWFLKKLKRAGVAKEDLAYFFQTVVRPILEYACPAWHTSLTNEQSMTLENITPAPCSLDHCRQYPVRRSLSFIWLAYASWTTS